MPKGEDNLNLDTFKNALGDDDLSLLSGYSEQEINSIEDLQTTSTEGEPNTDQAGQDDDKKGKESKDATSITGVEVVDDIEDTEEPENTQTDTTNTKVQSELLKVFTDNLKDSNIIAFEDKDFEEAEDKEDFIFAKIQDTINSRVDEAIKEKEAEWPKEIQDLVELHKKGVPLYDILEADSRIDSLEGIDQKLIEENEDLQKDIITELLSRQGFSREKISAKIKRYEDLGTLQDEASEGFDTLLQAEKKAKEDLIKQKQQEADARKDAEVAWINSLKDRITKSEEIIKGLKLSDNDKKALIDGITKVAGKTKTGEPYNAITKAKMEDPDMDLKIAYFTLILKGDLSKIQTATNAKTAKKLKDVLNGQEPMAGSSHGTESAPDKLQNQVNKKTMKAALNALSRYRV